MGAEGAVLELKSRFVPQLHSKHTHTHTQHTQLDFLEINLRRKQLVLNAFCDAQQKFSWQAPGSN